ncbi:UNVERIFIED_CONTAM: hypothetical protein FKN15_016393 [Acipenser sinensis]
MQWGLITRSNIEIHIGPQTKQSRQRPQTKQSRQRPQTKQSRQRPKATMRRHPLARQIWRPQVTAVADPREATGKGAPSQEGSNGRSTSPSSGGGRSDRQSSHGSEGGTSGHSPSAGRGVSGKQSSHSGGHSGSSRQLLYHSSSGRGQLSGKCPCSPQMWHQQDASTVLRRVSQLLSLVVTAASTSRFWGLPRDA